MTERKPAFPVCFVKSREVSKPSNKSNLRVVEFGRCGSVFLKATSKKI
jgi:hypothetical protein